MPKALGPSRHFHADLAKTNDAEGLAAQFRAL